MKKYIFTALFAIAMGFLEAAVVIYMRKLLYPEGFSFPLVPIPDDIALIEILREASTLLMLLAVAFVAGKNFMERIAWFAYCFAFWDIFYYVFLKIFIGWPASLFTWDILFLIPVTWTGPVIAPIITSLSMIGFAVTILYFSEKEIQIKITLAEYIMLASGIIILFMSYIWDYSCFILKYFNFYDLFLIPNKKSFFATSIKYIPEQFNWFLFICGQALIVCTIILIATRLKRLVLPHLPSYTENN